MTNDDAAEGRGAGPLAGVTVVDMSNMLMGPFSCMLLAELGARVIKVEPPSGDLSRGIDDREGSGLGPIYLNTNRGKESIVLDLRDAADHEVFRQIAATADVLVHNRPPGSDRRLGIDKGSLAELNPRLIVCALHGFGSTGRYGPLPAYDDVVQGISGLAAHQTGDGAPQYIRTPLTDKVTGMLAVGAITAALYEREQSGVGQHVEVPMFETMVQFLLVEQQGGFVYDPPRWDIGYARTNSPHRRPMATVDGVISILPSTDAHWLSVFSVLGESALADDPRFATITARTTNIDELYEWMSGQIARWTTEDLLPRLQKEAVPAMRVNSLTDLFVDPHLVETGFFEPVTHPSAGRLLQARAPFRFSRSGTPSTEAAPDLDSHGTRLRDEIAR